MTPLFALVRFGCSHRTPPCANGYPIRLRCGAHVLKWSFGLSGNDFAGRVDDDEVVGREDPTFLDESTDKRIAQRVRYRYVLWYPPMTLSEATRQLLRHRNQLASGFSSVVTV